MSDYNRMPPSDFNLPPGCYNSDPHFNDEEPDDDVVEATNLECGCVEYSNGDKDMCETHDAEFMANALGGKQEVA